MKAAVLYRNEDIRYEEWDEPKILPGTVKVKIKACGICGSDVPRVLKNGAHYYPIILGHEFSGIVSEISDDVSNVQLGDHVAGVPLLPCMKCKDCQIGNYSQCKHYSFIGSRKQGGFAEYVVLPEKNVVKVDKNLSFEQVALFEPSTVALHGLKVSGYKGGGKVAILGGGTIGLFALQWARIYGAESVTVFGRSKEHLKLATVLGADHIISTLDDNFMEQAQEITGNEGFDYIYETAGSSITMKLAFELAANQASVCFVGTPTEDITFSPRLWENLNRKEFKLTGSWMSCTAPFPGKEWEETAHFFSTGQLKYIPEMFHAIYNLSDADKAFAEFHDRNKVKGRILLVTE